jgi:hypothetical protein
VALNDCRQRDWQWLELLEGGRRFMSQEERARFREMLHVFRTAQYAQEAHEAGDLEARRILFAHSANGDGPEDRI